MAAIEIRIQRDAEQAVSLNFPTNCGIEQFQMLIENIYGPGAWQYSFICHGQSFDVNNETDLAQLKGLLVPKVTLFAYVRMRGSGSSFVNVQNTDSMKRIAFSTAAPAWRLALPGLCLEGKCTNGKCDANEKMVIVNIGIVETFNLNIQKRKLSRCPQCQQYVNPITCAFNRCEWKYHGQYEKSNAEPIEAKNDWTKADHAYYRFDDKLTDYLSWLELVFEVRSSEKS